MDFYISGSWVAWPALLHTQARHRSAIHSASEALGQIGFLPVVQF